jgi:hypothetical protein
MTNAVVNKKNEQELKKIPSTEYVSVAYITGDYPTDIMVVPQILSFKK